MLVMVLGLILQARKNYLWLVKSFGIDHTLKQDLNSGYSIGIPEIKFSGQKGLPRSLPALTCQELQLLRAGKLD
jgi:hypothetical protein